MKASQRTQPLYKTGGLGFRNELEDSYLRQKFAKAKAKAKAKVKDGGAAVSTRLLGDSPFICSCFRQEHFNNPERKSTQNERHQSSFSKHVHFRFDFIVVQPSSFHLVRIHMVH